MQINIKPIAIFLGLNRLVSYLLFGLPVLAMGLNARGQEVVGLQDVRLSDMGPAGSILYSGREPAIAYNSNDNEYLVVWRGDDNTGGLVLGEFEIYALRLDAATGLALGAPFRISDMGNDGDSTFGAAKPAVAYNSQNNRYLVVWQGDDNTALLVEGELEIFGQLIGGSAGFQIGADFRISNMGTDGDDTLDAFAPAIIYNSTNQEFLVAWFGCDDTLPLVNAEGEIFVQRLDGTTGAELGVNDFRISDMGPNGDPLYDAINPAIAYDSLNNQYLVVWQGDDNSGLLVEGEFEIFGQLLNAVDATELGSDFRISDMGPDASTAYRAVDPGVVFNPGSGEYLVVWSGDDNSAPLVDGEFEIFGQRIAGSTGGEIGTNDFRISSMGPDGLTNFRATKPFPVYDNSLDQYWVAWSGDDNTGTLVDNEFEIFVQIVNAAAGAEVDTPVLRVSNMGPDGNAAYQAFSPSPLAYNSANGELFAVWRADDDTSPLVDGEFEVFGRRIATTRKLLMSEVVFNQAGAGYIEIYNPGVESVSLENYYLTDANAPGAGQLYYNIVAGTNAGGGSASDFHARFPANAIIAAGEYQTVAMSGTQEFPLGEIPTYELYEDGAADSIPDMIEAFPGSINNQGGLRREGESLVLYFWDGLSDLVIDIDYIVWGDREGAVNKSGASIDGPDADVALTPYQDDVPLGLQEAVLIPALSSAIFRLDFSEGNQTNTDSGNGIGNRDETSENFTQTWAPTSRITPNAPAENAVRSWIGYK